MERDDEGPWPKPGTPIPPGVQVAWTNKNGEIVCGAVVDRHVRIDVVKVRSTHILGTGPCIECRPDCHGEGCVGRNVRGDPHDMPQAKVTIDFWPGKTPPLEPDFTLANPPPKREKWKGEPVCRQKQTVLLSGLNLLPGQRDLFSTDGSDECATKPTIPITAQS